VSDEFPHGQTIYRDRRAAAAGSYNPDATKRTGAWGDELALPGAYLDIPSATAPGSGTRSQALSERVLFVPDQALDVQKGDRIRIGGTVEEPTEVWFVNVPPARVKNPFTGWKPPMEIPLEQTEG
jgi:hypothetical protein